MLDSSDTFAAAELESRKIPGGEPELCEGNRSSGNAARCHQSHQVDDAST
jgi:hypothetical protein